MQEFPDVSRSRSVASDAPNERYQCAGLSSVDMRTSSSTFLDTWVGFSRARLSPKTFDVRGLGAVRIWASQMHRTDFDFVGNERDRAFSIDRPQSHLFVSSFGDGRCAWIWCFGNTGSNQPYRKDTGCVGYGCHTTTKIVVAPPGYISSASLPEYLPNPVSNETELLLSIRHHTTIFGHTSALAR